MFQAVSSVLQVVITSTDSFTVPFKFVRGYMGL